MKAALFFLLLISNSLLFAQNNNSLATKLISKWKAVSKVETEKTDGKVTDTDNEIYKTGEKSYEFTKKNTVIITQDFGKHKEELPISISGNKVFIGKANKSKDPYIFNFEQGKLKLIKTETETKKGKKIIETEVVILQQ